MKSTSSVMMFDHEFYFLTSGVSVRYAQFPASNKITALLGGLKEHGFIARDTDIEYFMVLFGIPLHRDKTPFQPIKWRKNRQLLRYFIYSIFPRQTLQCYGFLISPRFFADKHGESIYLPSSDLKRLKTSSEYDLLVDLLKKFNT